MGAIFKLRASSSKLANNAGDAEGRQVQGYQQLVAIRNPDVEYQRVGGQCPSGLCNPCTKEPCVLLPKIVMGEKL